MGKKKRSEIGSGLRDWLGEEIRPPRKSRRDRQCATRRRRTPGRLPDPGGERGRAPSGTYGRNRTTARRPETLLAGRIRLRQQPTLYGPAAGRTTIGAGKVALHRTQPDLIVSASRASRPDRPRSEATNYWPRPLYAVTGDGSSAASVGQWLEPDCPACSAIREEARRRPTLPRRSNEQRSADGHRHR